MHESEYAYAPLTLPNFTLTDVKGPRYDSVVVKPSLSVISSLDTLMENSLLI